MNINMGSQVFQNVEIPLLWGTRAIIQDSEGQISIIDLSGATAELEVVSDVPAEDITFSPNLDGFIIIKDSQELYNYNPTDHSIRSITLNLPEIKIKGDEITVGTSTFSGNRVYGYSVGIRVSENGMALGAPMPSNLAKLII
jgi:hypothetical protein